MILKILLLMMIDITTSCIWQKAKAAEIKQNNNNSSFNKDIYKKRMNWLLSYILISIFLFWLVWILKHHIENDISHIIFSLASNFLGASIFGYRWRIDSKANPFPTYLVKYPIIIIAFSALTFALTTIVLSLARISNELVFYSSAFFIGFYCGQHIDNVKDLGTGVKDLIKKS